MAIRNINTIQNPADLAYFVNNYELESLSNLGQRFSIKGDGISSLSFTIKDFLTQSDITFTRPMAKISNDGQRVYLSVYDDIETYNIDNPIYNEELLYTFDTTLITDNPIKLNIRINGVDEYDANGFIYTTYNSFVYGNVGVDIEQGNIELNVGVINKESNRVNEYLKFLDYVIEYNGVKCHPLIYIENTDTNTSEYIVKFALINVSMLNSTYGTLSDAIEYIYKNYVFEYLKDNGSVSLYDIYCELLNYGFEEVEMLYDMATYDMDGYKGLYFNNDHILKNEINTILAFINNDINYLYPTLLDIHNDYVYKYDNNQLHKLILFAIYQEAYNDYNTTSYSKSIVNFELFIPIDYVFDYYCNDNDKFYIYGNQSPVSIYFAERSAKINREFLAENYESLIGTLFTTTKEANKLNLYNFTCVYNNKYNKIINEILVNKLYSTPYIIDGYWAINNIKTEFKAIGENAGNPNIIITYTDDISNIINQNDSNTIPFDDYIKILTTTNKDILEQQPLMDVTFTSDLLVDFITDDYTFNVHTIIPKLNAITDDIAKVFEHSILINLTHINNAAIGNIGASDKLRRIYGQHSFITSLWCCEQDENTGEYEFRLIKNPFNINNALTLSNIENTNSLIQSSVKENLQKYAIPADNYNFTYLVFDDAAKTPKNNDYTVIYPVLYNSYDMFASNSYNSIANGTATISSGHLTPEFAAGFNKTNETIKHQAKKYLNNYIDNNEYSAVNIFEYISAYEFIPNTFMPFLNLSEVLVENEFLLNRNNLFIFDNDSEHSVYYSYFGTSIYDKNKSVLHLGTANKTPLGYLGNSLFDGNTEFKETTELHVDIAKTVVNSHGFINNAYYNINKGLIVNHDFNSDLQSLNLNYIYGTTNVVFTATIDELNNMIVVPGKITHDTNYTVNIGANVYNAISVSQVLKYIEQTDAMYFGNIVEDISNLNIVINNVPTFVVNSNTLETKIVDRYILVNRIKAGNLFNTKLTVDIINDTIYITCNDFETPLFNDIIIYKETIV